MCGRYYIGNEEETIEMREILDEVNRRYLNAHELAAMKTGEIFPTEIVPVLTAAGNAQKAELMKWGFPRFNGSGVIINARAESVNEKPMFQKCAAKRRCLIPADGFFEWKETGPKKKQKYMLRSPDEHLLYFAGLYNIFKNEKGSVYPAFVILTTAANESVLPIHDRMPYILTGNQKEIWLYDNTLCASLLNSECDARLSLAAM